MRKSKVVVLTMVSKDTCPSEFAKFWDGDLFYINSKSGGIENTLNLCRLLKFKYIKSVDMLAGDFCLMPNLVK